MLISKPTPFDEAIRKAEDRQLLPTTLDSAGIRKLGAAVIERSVLSARVNDARILQGIYDATARLTGVPHEAPGDYMGIPEARLQLKGLLASIGYTPEPGTEGTIRDLTTDQRLNLILQTQTEQAFGFGQYQQQLAVSDAYHGLELLRREGRKVPRDWFERWDAAGGELYDGRMIALIGDPVWQALGDGEGGYEDTLGNYYPPFAFNSGMDTYAVDLLECIELGLITEGEKLPETEADYGEFGQGLEAGVSNLAGWLTDLVVGSLFGYSVTNGVLSQ